MESDFLKRANVGVQGLMPYQPGKPVDELERELGISNIIKLASNENPLGLSEEAQKAVAKVVTEGSRYPDGGGVKLKEKLAARLAVKTSQITLGNGSNDLLDLLARVFANSETEVIYSQYSFAVYALATQAVGAKAVVVPAKEWGHDLTAMADAVTSKTSLIFLANPNNPTGTWFAKADLQAFMDKVPASVVVVLDEAYIEYSTEADFPDGVALLNQYPNLVVTRTFSKAYGLASMRVGYSLSNSTIADLLNRIRQPFNVNSFALAAAEAVLDDADYLTRSLEVNNSGLAQLKAGLVEQGYDVIPSAGNFVTFSLGQDAMSIYQKLLHEGVIVRPVANYQMPQHLRVSVGLKEENARFLLALEKVIEL